MAEDVTKKKCEPCEGGVDPMTEDEEDAYLRQVPKWKIDRETVHRIKRMFEFKDFREAMQFVNGVADIAEDEGHHPNLYINYNKVLVELYTHAIGGLSINDYIVAARINKI